MTTYDGVMLGMLLLGMLWGALRGITWQVASIASLVLGYLVAFPLSGQIAPHFPGEPVVARSLALLAAYVGVSGSVFLVAWLIRATLREWKFEAFDRHLGMILGGIEGLLLGLLGTVFVVSLAPQTRTPIFSSFSGKVVCRVLDTVEPILPGEIRTELAHYWTPQEADIAGATSQPESNQKTGTRRDDSGQQWSADDAASKASNTLEGLVEQGEARVGQAIGKALENGFEPPGNGSTRNVERR